MAIDYKKIIKLAKSYGFDGAEYIQDWGEHKVFLPTFNNPTKDVFIGQPIIILYDGKDARIASDLEWEEYIKRR